MLAYTFATICIRSLGATMTACARSFVRIAGAAWMAAALLACQMGELSMRGDRTCSEIEQAIDLSDRIQVRFDQNGDRVFIKFCRRATWKARGMDGNSPKTRGSFTHRRA